MRTFVKTGSPILLVVLLLMVSCRSRTEVYDGFETPELAKIWSRDRMVGNALEMQSRIVRSGQSAAKITLRSGDIFEAAVGKSKATERDELEEAERYLSVENHLYEYQFSLFLPDSFPVVPTRLVIAQWKQYCGGVPECSDDSPVLAIRYVSGRLYITSKNDSASTTIYQTNEEIRNKWLDFRFRVLFSRSDRGQVLAWLNGKQIVNFHGISSYSSKRGYPQLSLFYFKMGLYRDLMPEPMTIYIDEYRKKELEE
jgi:hypothetical protein